MAALHTASKIPTKALDCSQRNGQGEVKDRPNSGAPAGSISAHNMLPTIVKGSLEKKKPTLAAPGLGGGGARSFADFFEAFLRSCALADEDVRICLPVRDYTRIAADIKQASARFQ